MVSTRPNGVIGRTMHRRLPLHLRDGCRGFAWRIFRGGPVFVFRVVGRGCCCSSGRRIEAAYVTRRIMAIADVGHGVCSPWRSAFAENKGVSILPLRGFAITTRLRQSSAASSSSVAAQHRITVACVLFAVVNRRATLVLSIRCSGHRCGEWSETVRIKPRCAPLRVHRKEHVCESHYHAHATPPRRRFRGFRCDSRSQSEVVLLKRVVAENGAAAVESVLNNHFPGVPMRAAQNCGTDAHITQMRRTTHAPAAAAATGGSNSWGTDRHEVARCCRIRKRRKAARVRPC